MHHMAALAAPACRAPLVVIADRHDLRKELAWADKLFVREVAHGGKTIRVVDC